jgi:cytochrome c oxidase subunit 1
MPRRYYAYPPEFQVLNVASTAGASILAIGYILPVLYLVWSLFKGAKAPSNPWNSPSLEWQSSSPPPKDNFEEAPVMTHEAYDYAHMSQAQGALDG